MLTPFTHYIPRLSLSPRQLHSLSSLIFTTRQSSAVSAENWPSSAALPPLLPSNLACLTPNLPPGRLHFSRSSTFAQISQRRSLSTFQPYRTQLQAVLGEADEMDAYNFPDARLKKKLNDPSKTPLLLVACGSFSPITFLHLRMFVMADDYVKHNTSYEVVGGYLSPVSDAYRKQGLAPAEHRYVLSGLRSCPY